MLLCFFFQRLTYSYDTIRCIGEKTDENLHHPLTRCRSREWRRFTASRVRNECLDRGDRRSDFEILTAETCCYGVGECIWPTVARTSVSRDSVRSSIHTLSRRRIARRLTVNNGLVNDCTCSCHRTMLNVPEETATQLSRYLLKVTEKKKKMIIRCARQGSDRNKRVLNSNEAAHATAQMTNNTARTDDCVDICTAKNL